MAFLTTPIFTRIMSKPDYGKFSVFSNWQMVLVVICSVEVYSTLNRARLDYIEKERLNGYITSSLLLSFLVTCVFLVVYMIWPEFIGGIIGIDRRYMIVLFGYLFTHPALNMFQAKQRIEYKYKFNAILSFIIAIGSSLLALLLVLHLPDTDKLYGRILGQYALPILAGFVFLCYFAYISRSVRTEYWKYALRIGLPMVFSYLAGRVLMASDTFVIQQMGTAEQVSNLSVTHSVSHIIGLLIQTINMAWAPWVFDMLKADRMKAIRKAFRLYLWGGIGCTVIALIVGPELIAVMGGKAYAEALMLLPPYILSGGVFTILTAQLANLETYHKRPEYAAILTGVTAILNIILDIIGVRLWDYRAVCYATALCQIILVLLHYACTRKFSVSEILSPKTLVLSIGVSIVLIPLSLILYRFDIIRYLLIAALGIVGLALAVKYRGKIRGLIHRFR